MFSTFSGSQCSDGEHPLAAVTGRRSRAAHSQVLGGFCPILRKSILSATDNVLAPFSVPVSSSESVACWDSSGGFRLLHKLGVTSVIVGARKAEQLLDNLGAAKLALSADDMGRLDEVSKLAPEYPAWTPGSIKRGQDMASRLAEMG